MITTLADFKFLLKEGLIKKYSITKYKDNLLNQLKRKYIDCTIDIITDNEFIVKYDNIYQLSEIFKICINLFGYFPNKLKYRLNNGHIFEYDKEFEPESIIDNLTKNKLIKNIISIEIYFEARLTETDNSTNTIFYHWTKMKYLENIQNIGLVSKSKNRITVHPERIYLFTDINNKEFLLKKLRASDIAIEYKRIGSNKNLNPLDYSKLDKYALLKIELENPKDIILYQDPKFTDGYYTNDNIKPELINIIENNQ